MRRRLHTVPVLALAALAWAPAMAAAQESHAAHKAQPAHVMVNAPDLEWGDAPASLPPGARAVVIEGNPSQEGPFTLRLQMPDGYRIMPHSHPGVEHVTVLSGSFHIGVGQHADFDSMTALQAGGFMAMPPHTVHYAQAVGETVVQLHGLGPWGIQYANPQDDPRRQ